MNKNKSGVTVVESESVDIAVTVNGVPDKTSISATARANARFYQSKALLAEETTDKYSHHSSEYSEWMSIANGYRRIAEAFKSL